MSTRPTIKTSETLFEGEGVLEYMRHIYVYVSFRPIRFNEHTPFIRHGFMPSFRYARVFVIEISTENDHIVIDIRSSTCWKIVAYFVLPSIIVSSTLLILLLLLCISVVVTSDSQPFLFPFRDFQKSGPPSQ